MLGHVKLILWFSDTAVHSITDKKIYPLCESYLPLKQEIIQSPLFDR